MMFLDSDRAFFTPYQAPEELMVDLAYIITDPCTSFYHLAINLCKFLLCSIPLTLGLLSFNLPFLVLLSLPLALSILTVTTPMLIALAAVTVLAAPAAFSLGLVLYDVVDMVLSPIIDVLRIITNVGATLVDLLPDDLICSF